MFDRGAGDASAAGRQARSGGSRRERDPGSAARHLASEGLEQESPPLEPVSDSGTQVLIIPVPFCIVPLASVCFTTSELAVPHGE